MKVYKGKPANGMKKPKLSTRKQATKKQFFECVGGPYSGEKLYLSTDGSTLPFTANGETGRYISIQPTTKQTEWVRC